MNSRVLYVDDNLETGRATLSDLKPRELDTVSDVDCLKNPETIAEQLKGAEIVLMDYELHELRGGEETTEPALDGLELLERFRAAIRQTQTGGNHPPILVIFTAKFNELAELFDCVPVAAVVARVAKVDWVFEKGGKHSTSDKRLVDRIQELLDSYEQVRIDWPSDVTAVEEKLKDLLGLQRNGQASWSSVAFEQFRDTRPPIQSLRHRGGGVTLLRWLLQVALPFPSCFVDEAWVAVKLGVTPDSLRKRLELTPESELARELNDRVYNGLISEFCGRRYWRAGINELAWSICQGNSAGSPKVTKKLLKMASGNLEFLDIRNPVLVICPDDYMQHGDVSELDDAVQIQTDYWPPDVELPWVRKADIRQDSEISALVINKDKERLTAR